MCTRADSPGLNENLFCAVRRGSRGRGADVGRQLLEVGLCRHSLAHATEGRRGIEGASRAQSTSRERTTMLWVLLMVWESA